MKIFLCFLLAIFCFNSHSKVDLATIKKNGLLRCGVSEGIVGFSSPSSKGVWSGLDVDICKALAIAIFKDSSKVKYIPLSTTQRFKALTNEEIDILSRNTTKTLSRTSIDNIIFGPVVYFDTQRVLVSKKSGIKKISDLNKKKICVQKGTTSESNLLDYAKLMKGSFKVVSLLSKDETLMAFRKKRCQAISSDSASLISFKLSLKGMNLVMLDEFISKEPLAPVLKRESFDLYNLTYWIVNALIFAEENSISSTNVDDFLTSKNPKIKRFLGLSLGLGQQIGVDERWAYRIVKELGHYGEIYNKNLGASSKLKIKRDLNELYINGGLMYASPFR